MAGHKLILLIGLLAVLPTHSARAQRYGHDGGGYGVQAATSSTAAASTAPTTSIHPNVGTSFHQGGNQANAGNWWNRRNSNGSRISNRNIFHSHPQTLNQMDRAEDARASNPDYKGPSEAQHTQSLHYGVQPAAAQNNPYAHIEDADPSLD